MSIPLVQNNDKDAINTSIIAIKRNIERINMLLGLVDNDSPDLSGFATKQELQDAVTELQPVDEVTIGNMHSVTSNAVASSQEWKTLVGTDIKTITEDYNEIAVSVWFSYGENNEEVVYSAIFTKGMISEQYKQRLSLAGYYLGSTDYGICFLDNNAGVLSIRNCYYAGANFLSRAGMRIRYR